MRLQPCSRAILSVSAVFVLGACSGSNLEPVASCTDDQQVIVQVSPGTTPRFAWQPACGMASLQVSPTSGSAGGWVVYSGAHAPENPLPSGIRYGEVPPKGVQPGHVGALARGVAYRVAVYRWIGEPSGLLGSLFEQGHTTFVP